MKSFTPSTNFIAASFFLLHNVVLACNPLTAGTCPPVTALGTTVNVDFTKGASTQLPSSYNTVSYESDGVHLSVTKQGDSPILISPWYIMFGRFEVVFKSATGVGMVSSAILQSDDLDEIDWELLGANPTEAQTNYFGRGVTETYDREVTVSAPTATTGFNTYVIDWNQDRIIWSINGVALRTLYAANADIDSSGRSEYPQTPMQIKIGAWAGGDPSNPSGTISWAGGQINYGAGPYSMIIKSVSVSDYSTGSQYSYNSGTNGSWHDITATGGKVLGASSGSTAASSAVASKAATSSTPASTVASVASSSANVAASGSSVLPSSYETFPTSTAVLSSSSVNTRTGWPWVATSTPSAWSSATWESAGAAATTNTMSYISAGSSSSVAAVASSGASSVASSQAGSSSQASGAGSSQGSGVTASAVGGGASVTTMVTYTTSIATVNAGGASASSGSGTGAGSGSGASSGAAPSASAVSAAGSQASTSATTAAVATYTGGASHATFANVGIAICAAVGLVLAA